MDVLRIPDDFVVESVVQDRARERPPQFLLVSEESRYQAFTEALAVFWETDPPARVFGLYHRGVWPKDHFAIPGLFTSTLLHFAVALFLIRVPLDFLHRGHRVQAPQRDAPKIVYELTMMNLAPYLPTLKPPEEGGNPGRGIHPRHLPVRGATAQHSQALIVSNPPKPDNSRQTIVQPASPPELKIPNELRLPNVVIADAPPVPKPSMPSPPQSPTLPRSGSESPVVSATSRVPSDLPLALTLPRIPLPHLEVPLPSPPASPQVPKAKESSGLADLGVSTAATADLKKLVSLSVDPTPLTELIALPPGNRHGAFSMSPAGGQQGSPLGVPGGDTQGGTGGSGTGGDASAGLGRGGTGGGGGSDSGATVSINGSGGHGSTSGGETLPSSLAVSLVYPVIQPFRPRKPSLIVTTGPGGGGGLDLYGVLHGGKIYTIYLPMPGKSWVLQYCDHKKAARSAPQRSGGLEVQLDPGLAPPSIEEQFDFHRPPFPSDRAKDMIILHGMIQEDGSVAELEILRGLQETADQAAIAAFSRWRFKPALREGKPVRIEILVGIPASPERT